MQTIKSTLLVMMMAILASLSVNAQKKSTSSGTIGSETKAFCQKMDELSLQMPVYALGGESTIDKFKQSLQKLLSHYENSTEKLSQSSRNKLVESYSEFMNVSIYSMLSASGVDPRRGEGKKVLDDEVRKFKNKCKTVANQSSTLGQFLKKMRK